MGGPSRIDGKVHPETDNFLPCHFIIDGVTYSSSENYFQWAKATNEADRARVLRSGPGPGAWHVGQSIAIRPDWESVKVDEMYKGNLAKFQQNAALSEALVGSGTSPILFGDSTSFWNHWNGLIMERIRAELRQSGDDDHRRVNEIINKMKTYAQNGK